MSTPPPAAARPWFPYMSFARTQSLATPHPLTQSGMPAADPALFAELGPLDLGFAGAEALPRLRERIGAHVGVPAERVIVVLGASGAMHLAAAVLFRPGVRVAVETPSYEPLRALPARAGADVRGIERRLEEGWRIDVAAVERALAGAREGHVFLTTPHNPSGATTDLATLRELAALAGRHGGVLIANEIYLEFAPPGRAVRAASVLPNALSLGSLTKAYGLGPLRIGWIALGEGLAARRAEFEDALFLDYVDPPTIALRAGLHAFGRLAELRLPLERVERESKPVFVEWLRRAPGVRATVPELGIVAFAEFEGVADTHALQRYLAAEHGVGIVPGEFFGRAGCARLGFGLPPERLADTLARFERGLRAFRG